MNKDLFDRDNMTEQQLKLEQISTDMWCDLQSVINKHSDQVQDLGYTTEFANDLVYKTLLATYDSKHKDKLIELIKSTDI